MSILKTIMFHILLSLRRPILLIGKLLGILTIGMIIMFTQIHDATPIPPAAIVMTVLMGILSISICWFYDYLIFYMKPKMLEIALFR